METVRSKYFDKTYKNMDIVYVPFKFSIPNPIIRKKFIVIVKKSKFIADLGCGHGGTLHYLRKINKNAKITGIDFSKVAINKAKIINKNNKIKFLKKNLEKENFKYSKYDLVYCSQVIEHFANYQNFIKKISNSTQKNGYLLLTTTYKKKNAIYIYKNNLGQPSLAPDHINEFTDTKDLTSVLEKNGFKIIDQHLNLFRYSIIDIFIKFLNKFTDNDTFFNTINSPIIMELRYIFALPIFGFYNYQILAQKIKK